MTITHLLEFVDGDFETVTGKLISVVDRKHSRVDLCFDEPGANIAFARIVLHSKDLAKDADEVLESAKLLGEEIARRWNLMVPIPARHLGVDFGSTDGDRLSESLVKLRANNEFTVTPVSTPVRSDQTLTVDSPAAFLEIERIIKGTDSLAEKLDKSFCYPIQALAVFLLESFADFDAIENLKLRQWFEEKFKVTLKSDIQPIDWATEARFNYTFKRIDGAGSLDLLNCPNLESAVETFCADGEFGTALSPIGPIEDNDGNWWVMVSYQSLI